MFKPIITYASLGALLLVSASASGASKSDLNQSFKECINLRASQALEACENYVGYGGTEMRAFLRLGKLYQRNKEFSKAERVYELALKFNQESSSLKTKLKQSRSNSEEQAWMAANTQAAMQSDSATMKADRLVCVKMARVRPQKALDACNRYLSANGGDAEAQKSWELANTKLGKKNSPQTAIAGTTGTIGGQSIELASTSITASTSTRSSSNGDQVQIPASKPVQKQKPVQQVAVAEPAVDAGTIEEIKADLARIYSLVQEQKTQPEVTQVASAKPTYQESGKRRALVIGVSDYPASLGALKNPANDARDIARTLEGLNFEVDLAVNSGLREMEEIVAKFSKKLGPDDTAMFYYAGHGVQIDGENYLIPSGVEISDETDIKYKSVNLSYILEKIQSRGKGVNLVVLDACRDNPFGKSRSAGGQKGWATISGPVGTLIAYATAPGQVASDGAGDNGVYTKHLISQMTKPNIKVEDVFKGVRIAVDQETGGEQIPWENSSLIGDFYFSI